ncbi:MAG: hypothetical protein VB934_15200 [Polyangiaceae bacterium]
MSAPHQGTDYRFVSVERACLTAIATTCLFGGLLLAALLMCPFPFVVIVVWLWRRREKNLHPAYARHYALAVP